MITDFLIKYESTTPLILPSGHRVFVCRTTEGMQYAIADESGIYPHTTDDGPLYLDASRCLEIAPYVRVPVFSEDFRMLYTPADTATVLFLARWLSWIVADDQQNYYTIK